MWTRGWYGASGSRGRGHQLGRRADLGRMGFGGRRGDRGGQFLLVNNFEKHQMCKWLTTA